MHAASDTLGVPSNLCTTPDGFGTSISESTSLSYSTRGTPMTSAASCSPGTSAGFLIDAILDMLFVARLYFSKVFLMPPSMVSDAVS